VNSPAGIVWADCPAKTTVPAEASRELVPETVPYMVNVFPVRVRVAPGEMTRSLTAAALPLLKTGLLATSGILTEIALVGIYPQVQFAALFQFVFEEPVQATTDIISMVAVADAGLQAPEPLTVLVTVYMPGVLAEIFICPVLVLTNTSPAVEENVPAVPPPLNDGLGFEAFGQYGDPA